MSNQKPGQPRPRPTTPEAKIAKQAKAVKTAVQAAAIQAAVEEAEAAQANEGSDGSERVVATLHTSAADREPGGEVSEERIQRVIDRTEQDPIWRQDDEPAGDTVALIAHGEDGSETVLFEEPLAAEDAQSGVEFLPQVYALDGLHGAFVFAYAVDQTGTTTWYRTDRSRSVEERAGFNGYHGATEGDGEMRTLRLAYEVESWLTWHKLPAKPEEHGLIWFPDLAPANPQQEAARLLLTRHVGAQNPQNWGRHYDVKRAADGTVLSFKIVEVQSAVEALDGQPSLALDALVVERDQSVRKYAHIVRADALAEWLSNTPLNPGNDDDMVIQTYLFGQVEYTWPEF